MPKVKVFAAIPRKKGLDVQQFHDHWRHPHGSFARRISTITKYVQDHQVHCDLLDSSQTLYEGIAEVWLDTVEDALALGQEPVYVADIVADEPRFIDMEGLRFVVTEEDVVYSGPDRRREQPLGDAYWYDDLCSVSVKLVQLIGLEQRDRWRLPDERELGLRIGALRHVCCEPAAEAYRDAEPSYAGVRELWWPTLTAFRRGVTGNEAALRTLVAGRGPAILATAERFK